MRREVESVVGLSLDARVSETGQWKALRDLAIPATDSNNAQRRHLRLKDSGGNEEGGNSREH